MKIIPTSVHGVLDYMTSGLLVALPRMMGWSKPATQFFTGAALGTLGYSLLTRYELGAVKVMPMEAHIGLDTLNGLTLLTSPFWLLRRETKDVRLTLIALGLYELAAAAMSKTEPD